MTESSFGERFCYARWHEERVRPRESDGEFAAALDLSKASISAYRKATSPPPDVVVTAIAERTGVDPGWLAYGARSAAPEPPDFAVWLTAQRAEAPAPSAVEQLEEAPHEDSTGRPAGPAKQAANSRRRKR